MRARCKIARNNKSTSWVRKGLGWCFHMHCVEGLTQQEIAEKEKTSQSRISECVSLALKKVRRHFRVRQILPDIRKKY